MRIVLFVLTVNLLALPIIALAKEINEIINTVRTILGTAAVTIISIMMVWTALLFAVSMGNPKRIEIAKTSLVYTVTGAVILSVSYGLYRFIRQFLGMD